MTYTAQRRPARIGVIRGKSGWNENEDGVKRYSGPGCGSIISATRMRVAVKRGFRRYNAKTTLMGGDREISTPRERCIIK